MMLAWVLACALILLGLAGTLLPLLPGAPLILAGAIVHKLMLPEFLNGWMLALLTFLTAVSALGEAALAWAGARWFGAGTYGVAGAAIGALIGIFFAGIGAIPGAVIGAALAEWQLARRTPPDAAKAALGAGLGFVAGRALQAGLSILMAVLIVADWLIN